MSKRFYLSEEKRQEYFPKDHQFRLVYVEMDTGHVYGMIVCDDYGHLDAMNLTDIAERSAEQTAKRVLQEIYQHACFHVQTWMAKYSELGKTSQDAEFRHSALDPACRDENIGRV